MARKTLLTEGEIRQFMKLACLPAVGQGRLQEFVNFGKTGEEETPLEEEEEEGAELEAMADDQPPEGLEEPEVELGPDVGDDLEPEGEGVTDAEELVTRIAHDLEALAKMAGVDVDVEDDLEGEEEVEVEPVGLGADVPEEEEEVGGIELGAGGALEEEDIVNEVARRVAARLSNQNQKNEMVSDLAERILNRITSTK